ncbi:uncharacterized protein PFLUO_LOCUS7376 [Penicillium psychrofluorescens]|uniref:uncharacterized protein n=1 Tax=Penicillium psychrofluorescens TaxID=3158075 RepID=UPI003CCDD6C7
MKGFLLLSGLLATMASAHMQMKQPYPIRSPLNKNATGKIDYSYTNSLAPSGQDYPCKGYQNDPFVSEAKYTPGQSYEMELEGSATHGGGSCQLALTYDKGKTFKVIESMLGECPIPKKYKFTVPSDAPSGEALLAWTWFNKIGNREMYMNCAMVTIGGDSSRMTGNSVGMEKRESIDMPSMTPEEKKEAENDDDQSSTMQVSSTKENTSKSTDEMITTTTMHKEKPSSSSMSEKATDKPKPTESPKPTEKPKPTESPKTTTEKPKPTGKPKNADNGANNKQSTAFNDLPDLFVANVNYTGQCVTIEGQTVDFPEPGDNVMGKSDGKGYKCSGNAPFLGADASKSSNDSGSSKGSSSKDDSSKDNSNNSDTSSKDDSRIVSKQTMTKVAKVAQALSTAKSDPPRFMGTEATTNNEFHNYVGNWYCYDGELICSPNGLSWAQCANGYPVFMGPVAHGTLCRMGRMVSAGDWSF